MARTLSGDGGATGVETVGLALFATDGAGGATGIGAVAVGAVCAKIDVSPARQNAWIIPINLSVLLALFFIFGSEPLKKWGSKKMNLLV
jgi:hypothetical protein